MIVFNGIKYKNKVGHLVFADVSSVKGKSGAIIEIPMENQILERISSYLGKITVMVPVEPQTVDENE